MPAVEGLAPPSLSGASPRNFSAMPTAEEGGRFDAAAGGGGGAQQKRGKTPTEAMSLQEQAILANIQELQRQLWKVKSEQEKRESEELEEDGEGVSRRRRRCGC